MKTLDSNFIRSKPPAKVGSILALLSFVLCFVTAQAQDVFKIQEVRIAAGVPTFSHDSSANYYYILYRGLTVTSITNAAAAALGTAQKGQITDASRLSSDRVQFYRILRVPITAPLDLDSDGIDDVFELRNPTGLSALDPSDAGKNSGDGRTWLQRYSEGQPALISFVRPSSTVLSADGTISIPIRASKAFSGRIRVQTGGTALVGQDYSAFPLQLMVNGTEAQIQVPLVESSLLAQPRSLVLNLVEPPDGTYRIGALSSHSLIIQDSNRGSFAGTMVFTNGVQIAPQLFKMALRGRTGNTGTAYVDPSQSRFFSAPFSFAVQFPGPSNAFEVLAPASGTIQSTALGRPLAWTLELGQPVFSSSGLTTGVTLKIQGLSAADSSLDAKGILTLQALNSPIP